MIKEYFNSHYSLKKPMVLKNNEWFPVLQNMVMHLSNKMEAKLTDVEYVVDRVGLDMYLSFIDDPEYLELTDRLPKDTIYLFSNRFYVDSEGNFDKKPRMVAIFSNQKIEGMNILFSTTSNNFYIYSI
jgi:hypothetical protein